MKKIFLNDVFSFSFLTFAFLVSLALLLFGLYSAPNTPNPAAAIPILSVVLGFSPLALLLWLLIRTDVLLVDSHRVARWALFRKTVSIAFCDIAEIAEVKREIYGIGGYQDECWQIVSTSGQSIYMRRTKRRMTIMAFIRASMPASHPQET